MWSAYVFISLLCLKSHLGHPQTNLDNLGANIQDEVQKHLQPVYAMTIKTDMANGIGGTTVATYDGKTPRAFIITDGTRSICKGTIKGSQCHGTLEPFTINNREDYCYATGYAIINDNICVSSSAVHLSISTNKFECKSNDGAPVLSTTRQEFQNLCSAVTSGHVVYKYYANVNDPKAIPIPNSNPHVECLNSEPGVCEFEEHNELPGGSITPSDRGGGCNMLYQRFDIILLAVTLSFLFQY